MTSGLNNRRAMHLKALDMLIFRLMEAKSVPRTRFYSYRSKLRDSKDYTAFPKS